MTIYSSSIRSFYELYIGFESYSEVYFKEIYQAYEKFCQNTQQQKATKITFSKVLFDMLQEDHPNKIEKRNKQKGLVFRNIKLLKQRPPRDRNSDVFLQKKQRVTTRTNSDKTKARLNQSQLLSLAYILGGYLSAGLALVFQLTFTNVKPDPGDLQRRTKHFIQNLSSSYPQVLPEKIQTTVRFCNLFVECLARSYAVPQDSVEDRGPLDLNWLVECFEEELGESWYSLKSDQESEGTKAID